MAHFPMFVNLKGKKVLIVGGGRVAYRKIRKLEPFEPNIRVISPEICEDIQNAEKIFRRFRAVDLLWNPELVIAATDDRRANRKIAGLCRILRIPVNVVDIPELCSFFFPALIREGDLTVSVSTGGRNPGAAAWLREQIQRCIPDNTDLILDWLGQIRQMLRSTYPGRYAPVLRKITEAAFEKNRPLTETELEKIMESTDL